MSDQNSVRYIDLYIEERGQPRYRVEIEIRVWDMANYLAHKAIANRSKRSRMAFGEAVAKPVKEGAP